MSRVSVIPRGGRRRTSTSIKSNIYGDRRTYGFVGGGSGASQVQKVLRGESSASPRTPLPQDDGREERLASKRHKMRCNPFVKQGEAELAFRDGFHPELKSSLAADVQVESVE